MFLKKNISRARSEEKVIPLSYLQEMHDLHERWLMGDGANQGGTISKEIQAKVLVIDADQVTNLVVLLFQFQ